MSEERNCGNCRSFRLVWGRGSETCEQRGEGPTNPPCPQYRATTANVGALPDQDYADVFHEILAESFVMEQDLRLSVDTIKAQLQTQGANIEVDSLDFNRSSSRLIDLYVLYRLTMAIGLARYSDEIMVAEIQRQFGAKK